MLDNTFELLKLKNSTSQNVSSEPESKVDTDEYQSFNVTAYTAGYESTQKKKGHPLYGITASGERAKEGVTAACPKSLPFGTKIYIEELNHTYVCQDRGGAIKEGHLDIYYDNLKDAKEFGRNQMRVKIIKVS
ncbi:MAG: hypothetical protein K0S39_5842 [Paenibacillus sp.]|nr:hypothetical protein [Paenibacillus sp.]